MKKQIILRFLSCVSLVLSITSLFSQEQHLLAYQSDANSGRFITTHKRKVGSYSNAVDIYVNAKAACTFLRAFPDASTALWHFDKDHYEVSFKQTDQTCNVLIGENGQLLYTIRIGSENDLPREVRNLVKSKYFDYTIGIVKEVDAFGVKAWVINLKDKDHLVVVHVVDGVMEELHRYKTHS